MSLRHAVMPLLIAAALPATSFSTDAATRGLQARDLASMDRFSSPTVSPDGRHLVFAKRTADLEANKSSTGLWTQDLFARDGAAPNRLTPDGWNVNSPSFAPDGKSVYFLSAKSGKQQLYSIPAAGGTPKQISSIPLDIGSYKISPQGDRYAFSTDVFPGCGVDFTCTSRRLEGVESQKATGVVYDKLFIRHWDTWTDGRVSRLVVADLAPGAKASKPVLVGGDDAGPHVGDVPSKPFGDASEYTWSPDGKSIVYSVRDSSPQEPWSTNFDLFQYRIGEGVTNLTETNKAWDTNPVFSADGRTLFYRAMKRPGFEADRFGLYALDLASGERREIAPDWDRSANGITLSEDGRTIYTTAQDMGQHPLFAVHVKSGGVTRLVGDGSVSSVALAGPTLAFTRASLKSGDQVMTGGIHGAPLRAITPGAQEMLPEVAFGDFEQFAFKGWNNEAVHGYVVKPWDYQEGQSYPVAFLIHGGPQGSFGNGWSYRWNPQTYAGQGYAVVMINFHGSTGYGQAFTDAISQHWGDRPLVDLQKGWAAARKQYPFLDGDKACALGASYGGYMVNWIAGNWNEPWKCLVNHDGIFDLRSMGYVTEELWFTEWEHGGTPYEVPENYERFNPVSHVDKWRVPMLVVQGGKDYRVPEDQSIATFTALQRQGIESKLLYFPDENHWVLKPQNLVQWHETVNGWLEQHIGR
ncbi:MAG: S9 family peptidase [Pseudomonadota bacterium]|nr:S9 family peptidase [Pseudomonadota bacterium]